MSWEPIESKDEVELRLHFDMHGSFLEVPILLLMLMEMPPCVFSKYSRVHKDRMYLEEDLDAGKFISRFEYMYGDKPELTPIDHGETALDIRGYTKNPEGQDVTIH